VVNELERRIVRIAYADVRCAGKERYGTLSSPCSTAMYGNRSLARIRVHMYVTYISGIVGLIGIDLSDSVAARILTEATALRSDTSEDK